ncbi:hypothetical protein GPA22_21540 [Aromatoleum toluvorans]|uniref:Uncharacterized protein n=1 Tax=Aromatoleum toluvorans TaxID=92002 RepID=A0ABX1Q3J7_9RHOO|nr:hypothetical protein [Aromatoleum toluvorans]NMG46307.1 hypothetical protein [Aromatoleum toluvorans]
MQAKQHRFLSFASISPLAAGLLAASLAHAEAPMNVDDAGTLDRGGAKIEGAWTRDGRTHGGELVFGFSPIDALELEVGAGREREGGTHRETHLQSNGFGAKWVPFQNEKGWSLGARLDFGRTRVDPETPEQFTERRYALTGLASYRFENDQVLHLNLGAERVRADGNGSTAGTWGIGYEFPLADRLQLTLETFGAEHARPDRAVGLRYEIRPGLKVSGAIGRGDGRSFGQAGFAWEF